ncbi:hypothetical protein D3C79_1007980 [compost metagenome]
MVNGVKPAVWPSAVSAVVATVGNVTVLSASAALTAQVVSVNWPLKVTVPS